MSDKKSPKKISKKDAKDVKGGNRSVSVDDLVSDSGSPAAACNISDTPALSKN